MVIVNYRNKKICPDTSKMGLDILSISWILQKWLRTSNLYPGYSRYKIGYSGNGFGHPIYISDTLGISPDTSEIGSDICSTVSQLQMFFKFILKIYLIQIKQQNTSKNVKFLP